MVARMVSSLTRMSALHSALLPGHRLEPQSKSTKPATWLLAFAVRLVQLGLPLNRSLVSTRSKGHSCCMWSMVRHAGRLTSTSSHASLCGCCLYDLMDMPFHLVGVWRAVYVAPKSLDVQYVSPFPSSTTFLGSDLELNTAFTNRLSPACSVEFSSTVFSSHVFAPSLLYQTPPASCPIFLVMASTCWSVLSCSHSRSTTGALVTVGDIWGNWRMSGQEGKSFSPLLALDIPISKPMHARSNRRAIC
mmetsp:Transcript_23307/g.59596  ORF Transcript_23307/g.59596 Transcript_23307/m.59596 type:complete len:247 (-) Transcript_23307:110-850(-)